MPIYKGFRSFLDVTKIRIIISEDFCRIMFRKKTRNLDYQIPGTMLNNLCWGQWHGWHLAVDIDTSDH